MARRKPILSASQLGGIDRARAGIRGYGTYTRSKTKAVLSIGRTAGLTYGRWREGQTIPADTAIKTVLNRRIEQIPARAAAATVFNTTGYYGGGRENAVRVEIAWTPGQEKTPQQFVKNIRHLAESVAGDLAQREVLVEWEGAGRTGRVDSATPKAAPAPTSGAFCRWVAQHSPSARTNPQDPCYSSRSKK